MIKSKRILSLVVALMMVLTILPASLLVSAGNDIDGYTDTELATMFNMDLKLVAAVKTAITQADVNADKTTAAELRTVSILAYDGVESGNKPLPIITPGFAKLTGLTELTLTNHRFSNLSGLPSMPELTKLKITENPFITDVSYLYAPKLQSLTVTNCATMTNISGVSGKTNLNTVTVTGNPKLTSVSALSSCTNLVTATLNNNGITSLYGLNNLTYMTTLDLSNNAITSISGFSYNTARSLNSLTLVNNKIATISSDSYVFLGVLGAGLNLDRNALSKAELVKSALTTANIGTQYNVTAYGVPTTITGPTNIATSTITINKVTKDANGNFIEGKLPIANLKVKAGDEIYADITSSSGAYYYTLTPYRVGTVTLQAVVQDIGLIDLAKINVSTNITSSLVINEKQNPNISVNSQKLISATLSPYTGVTQSPLAWESSNPSIITVYPNSYGGTNTLSATLQSYGVTGSATITVKTTDGSNKSDSMTVTVVNSVTSISMISPKTSMQTDETQNLAIAYTPANATNKSVSYVSSNESLASVSSSGVVTAKMPGTVTITATTVGNDLPRSTYVTITITEGPLGIKLDKKNTKIYIDQELQVKAKVSPTYLATGIVTWKSEDSSIASVDSNGKITGRKVGKTTISAKYSKDGETVGAYIDIEVANPSVKIALDDYAVTLSPDKTSAIEYKVTPSDLPNKKVTFTSSNEDVAIVTEEGVIIAGSAGKATITVKSDYNSKYVARVSVTVKPATPSLKVTRGTYSAKLTAGTSDGATRYRYYVKSKSSDSYKRIADTTSKTFTATGLKSGQTYYFAVRSYYVVDGKNVYSGYKKVTSSVAPATPKFTYSKTNSSVTLKVSNPPAGAKYVYYMKYNSGESFFRISDGTTKTSFTERDLVKGETYYFTVRQYKTSDSKNVYSKYTTLKVKI